jgi:hypothetical protein
MLKPSQHLYIESLSLGLPKRMPVPEVANHLVCSICGTRNDELKRPIHARPDARVPGVTGKYPRWWRAQGRSDWSPWKSLIEDTGDLFRQLMPTLPRMAGLFVYYAELPRKADTVARWLDDVNARRNSGSDTDQVSTIRTLPRDDA